MRSPRHAKRADPNGRSAASKSVDSAERPVGLAPGTLVVVATPIGNLGDLGARAAAALAAADLIACEDTRVTAKLLSAYGIVTATTAYHDHNAARVRPGLIERLKSGQIVALVSDAGTPLVSDPGFKLVEAAIEAGQGVTAIPGPSAALTALVVSGLPCDRFLFAGFLPPKAAARRTAILELKPVRASLVFYESAGRLGGTLADLAAVLGDRRVAVARELTKRYEEVRRGRLADLAAAIGAEPKPKGEIVIVVAPPEADAPSVADDDAVDRALSAALERHSVGDAAALVAAETGLPRRVVYARALALRRQAE